jgi:gluconokinase
MEYFIGVDIGTTHTKAVAFDAKGLELYKYRVAHPLQPHLADHAEQDPQVLFRAVVESIRQVQAQLSGKPQGVALSTAMHALMAVDAQGTPLTQLMTWMDNRAALEAHALQKQEMALLLHQQNGTPLHAMSPLAKLLWLRRHQLERFEKARLFCGFKEYLWQQLFGEWVIDESLASATGLYHLQNRSWDTRLALPLAGINVERLPRLESVFYHKTLEASFWQQAMQLPEGTPFVLGGSDGCLANLGAGATKPGSLCVTVGTSGAVRACLPKPMTTPGLFCYALANDLYVAGGGMNNGGILLDWLRDNFLPEKTDLQALFIQAQTIPTGSDGLLCLPYLLGERAPIYNEAAKGVFFGMHLQHTRAHFVRAVLEGITLALLSIGELIDKHLQPVDHVYVGGGLAGSAFWIKMLSDVFGKKVYLTDTVEQSALGAVIVGRKALGISQDLSVSLPPVMEVSPDWEKHRIYQVMAEKFHLLYDKLKDAF